MLEKNFPTKKKWTFSIGFGYLFRGINKYTGSVAEKRDSIRSKFLIRPNVRF